MSELNKNLRQLSDDTSRKVLAVAATILEMHGYVAGNRVCQDWSGEDSLSPDFVFTKQELDDLSFNYEQFNSGGNDYDPDYNGMHDEMVCSFTISKAISLISEKQRSSIGAKVKFKDVPIGGRIREYGKTWVVMENYGDGLLQEYTGDNNPMLSVVSFVDESSGITLDSEVVFLG